MHRERPFLTSPSRQYHNVALVGFMGVGKSTVGNLLADILGFELIDTDKVIEQKEGKRISELFALHGEPYFRACEAALVAELATAKQKIISTGGGMITNPANLESLRCHSLIACLWASPETIFERVKNQTHRPLLQAPDPLAKIRELMTLRTPVYREAADIMVGVDYRHAPEVARHIAKSFQDAAKSRPNAAVL
jgi:shikimate kinase